MILEIDEILRIAEEQGIGAKELFSKAGLSHVTYWRHNTGRLTRSIETLLKLMDALNEK